MNRIHRWLFLVLALMLAAPVQAATIRIATLAPDGSLWDEIMSEMGRRLGRRHGRSSEAADLRGRRGR